MLALLERINPEVDVTAIAPSEGDFPAARVPMAMLLPALIVILLPAVVKFPSDATDVEELPAEMLIKPEPVVVIVSAGLRNTMGPSVATSIKDHPAGIVALPGAPDWPRESMVMAAAVIVTVSKAKSNVSVPLAIGMFVLLVCCAR